MRPEFSLAKEDSKGGWAGLGLQVSAKQSRERCGVAGMHSSASFAPPHTASSAAAFRRAEANCYTLPCSHRTQVSAVALGRGRYVPC